MQPDYAGGKRLLFYSPQEPLRGFSDIWLSEMCIVPTQNGLKMVPESWAPARGEQGGQAPTLEKIRVGMAHPGNFSRGLKTSWQ